MFWLRNKIILSFSDHQSIHLCKLNNNNNPFFISFFNWIFYFLSILFPFISSYPSVGQILLLAPKKHSLKKQMKAVLNICLYDVFLSYWCLKVYKKLKLRKSRSL